MSSSEVADGAWRQAGNQDEGLQDRSDDAARSERAPGAVRPETGDPSVDEVLRQLDRVADESLDTQIEVSEQVHRVLQNRLADLGKE